ncbi:MAG: beta-phosphoglucomutase [Luteibaculaceae bacterium]
MLNNTIKACIFDLDGVIVDTAHFHYLAWRKTANALGFDLTEAENENLKGVSRKESLDYILNLGGVSISDEEKEKWLVQKNDWYLTYIESMTPGDILPGVLDFLHGLENKGILLAIGSSSKNARPILERVKIKEKFTAIIDGTNIIKGKPNPEVFLKGAEAMNLKPEECLVFEDAIAGVQAALAGNFPVCSVGHAPGLDTATINISSTAELDKVLNQLS